VITVSLDIHEVIKNVDAAGKQAKDNKCQKGMFQRFHDQELAIKYQSGKHKSVLCPLSRTHLFKKIFNHGINISQLAYRKYNYTVEKNRIDLILEERQMCESRTQAQRLIMAGQVRVAGQVVLKPSTKIATNSEISIDQPPPFVSRGGEKLMGALTAFELLNLSGRVCADIGASTGGFTDCLLQHGASKVYAVDVGYGIMHWKLRNDPRVVVMERTNARYVTGFPEPISLITIDASFISLKIFLPVFKTWFGDQPGEVVALIKPQFEAGRQETARGDGVIRDTAVHQKVIHEILTASEKEGYAITGLIRSPLLGPKGNTEFLVHLKLPYQKIKDVDDWIAPLFPVEPTSQD
jgi:23S rRNA (cytidine1920-2'-O)/16S rRNA (cytidine1409-2'-O)-methyltransferase